MARDVQRRHTNMTPMYRYSVNFKMADGTITGVGLDARNAAHAWREAARLMSGKIVSRVGRAHRGYEVRS